MVVFRYLIAIEVVIVLFRRNVWIIQKLALKGKGRFMNRPYMGHKKKQFLNLIRGN